VGHRFRATLPTGLALPALHPIPLQDL